MKFINSFLNRFMLLIVTLPLLLILTGCRADPPENVILITLDTQRADFISAYQSENAATPHIDSLAKRGILFENAYSMIPITLPAHGAIFYSLPPHRLGVYNNGQIFTPPQNHLSLAEIFLEKGYTTAAFVSLGVLNSNFGFPRGFLHYSDSSHPSRWYLTAEEVNRDVFNWLDKKQQSPFFLWIHYSDPHEPYAPADLPPDLCIKLNGAIIQEICCQKIERTEVIFAIPPGRSLVELLVLNPFPVPRDEYRISLNDYEINLGDGISAAYVGTDFLNRGEKRSLLLKQAGKIIIDNPGKANAGQIKFLGNINLFPQEKRKAYQKETEYLDAQIGLLLEKLEKKSLISRSLILMVGDHGEGLGDYLAGNNEYYFGHIHYLNSVYLKIPMILYNPDSTQSGIRIQTPVTLLDTAPLIMDILKWRIPKPYAGTSPLSKKRNRTHRFFTETYRPEAVNDCFAARSYPWHLIVTPSLNKIELYYLPDDPMETRNVWEAHENQKEVLELLGFLRSQIAEVLKDKTEVNLDPKSLEMLKALGYLK